MMTDNYNISAFYSATFQTKPMLYCSWGDGMRKLSWLIAVVVTLLIPYLSFRILEQIQPEPPPPSKITEPPQSQSKVDRQVTVLQPDGKILAMDLEEYVGRVLSGEMPMSFDIEALKAQAVAIRTYTMRKAEGKGKHDNADVCTDSSCCQAYADIITDEQKLADAIEDTRGQVLTYDGKPIEATYFSATGGSTEDAVAVWGTDVPYLKAQPSPEEIEPKTVTFTVKQLQDRLQLDSLPHTVEKLSYTDGGGVASIRIGGRTFSGTEFRRLLSLPSTSFHISIIGDNCNITVKGNGHRVGMSQYGAETMALAGRAYYEVLEYYYPGTELVVME